MNVSSVSSLSANQLWELLQSGRTSQSTSTAGKSASHSDASSLSGPGQLFKELDSLSKSNPTEFKKITSQIAQQLQDSANSTKDPAQVNFLSQMAGHFSTASQSGNFGDLFPQQSQATPAVSGAASNSMSSVSTIYSKALAQIQADMESSSANE